MLGLLIDAAIIGVIVAVMESEEFPDWWRVILCALATAIVGGLVGSLLMSAFGPLGILGGMVVGALVGGLVISALCGMSVKRATIAASIYLGIRLAIAVVFYFALSAAT